MLLNDIYLSYIELHFLWVHHQAHHSSETYSLVNTFRLPFIQDWVYSVPKHKFLFLNIINTFLLFLYQSIYRFGIGQLRLSYLQQAI